MSASIGVLSSALADHALASWICLERHTLGISQQKWASWHLQTHALGIPLQVQKWGSGFPSLHLRNSQGVDLKVQSEEYLGVPCSVPTCALDQEHALELFSHRIGPMKPWAPPVQCCWKGQATQGCPCSPAISKWISAEKRWHKILLQIVTITPLVIYNMTRGMDMCFRPMWGKGRLNHWCELFFLVDVGHFAFLICKWEDSLFSSISNYFEIPHWLICEAEQMFLLISVGQWLSLHCNQWMWL